MESPIPNQDATLQDLEVKITKLSDPDGIELRERHREEVIAKYPAEAGVPPSTEDTPVFIILKLNGRPIACGGLRPLHDSENRMVELKRMYIVPECRGRSKGVGDLLMRQLELQAIDRGWTTLRLETGVDMPVAREYYEKHGYVEIPLFGHYINDVNSSQSVCYEKRLRDLKADTAFVSDAKP